MQSVTPELARVLKHELTHSFVSQMSGNRCPTWLNEGIAQMEEGRSSASNGRQLAQLFAAGNEIPFNVLEGSFMNFSAPVATVAYAESLAAAEYIRDAYGDQRNRADFANAVAGQLQRGGFARYRSR